MKFEIEVEINKGPKAKHFLHAESWTELVQKIEFIEKDNDKFEVISVKLWRSSK